MPAELDLDRSRSGGGVRRNHYDGSGGSRKGDIARGLAVEVRAAFDRVTGAIVEHLADGERHTPSQESR